MNDSFLQQITTDPIETVAGFYADRLIENPKAIAFVNDELHLTTEQAMDQKCSWGCSWGHSTIRRPFANASVLSADFRRFLLLETVDIS